MKRLLASGVGFFGLSGKLPSPSARKPKTGGGGNSHCYWQQSTLFGRAIRINVVSTKICPFDCIYCNHGRTVIRSVDQISITLQKEIIHEFQQRLRQDPLPEHIVISGSGDPAVCKGLTPLIGKLKALTSAPIVVVSSGGLFWNSGVQKELSAADIIVTSLDAADKTLFQCINRPIGVVPFARFLSGLMEFRSSFKGEFILRVTLLDGINAIEAEVKKLAELASQMGPSRILIQTASNNTVEDFAFTVERARLEYFTGFFKDIQTEVIEASAL